MYEWLTSPIGHFGTVPQLWLQLIQGRGLYAALFMASLLIMLIVGTPMIKWLRQKKWRKDAETWSVREDTPDTHQVKQGTPSMGGIGIIGTTAICYILAVVLAQTGLLSVRSAAYAAPRPINLDVLLLFIIFPLPFAVIGHAALGFADDWSKATGRGGLRARAKFMAQIGLAALTLIPVFKSQWLTLFAYQSAGRAFSADVVAQSLRIPGSLFPLLVWLCVVGVILVATSNAVNLTDGIDGLAAGLGAMTFLALCLVCIYFRESEAVIFNVTILAALAGSCLGFLWFNKHPAKVFMGDTGSLAIGAAVGTAAVLLKAVFLLPFIGFIFYVEMFSVIFQVAYFKWTKRKTGEGKRLFRRAPLHHHFELSGWSEKRVVATFWAINLVTTVIGLILWQMKILPRWP